MSSKRSRRRHKSPTLGRGERTSKKAAYEAKQGVPSCIKDKYESKNK